MDSERAYPARSLPTAMLLALALGACSNAQTPPPAPQAPEVSVVTVHRGSVPITTELPGRTSPYLVAQVRARVDGIVLKREFKEGSQVKAAQRLYQIDPAPYIAALNSATASLQKAEANLASTTAQAERYKVLVAANAVSKQDYDNAVASQGQAVPTLPRARRRWRWRRSTSATPTSYRRSRVEAACRRSRKVRTCKRAPRR